MKGIQSNGFLPIIAQAIAEMEEQHGEFSSIDDVNLAELGRKTGLSRAKLRRLKANGFCEPGHGLAGTLKPSILDGYNSVLDGLLRAGVSNSAVCLERLKALGFAGGQTTVKRYNVLEKSLGGVKKSGTSPLNEVYEYAYPVTTSGVCFMDTPGYDPIASTGQIAGGANMLCFTTGRGSCFGSVMVPVIKLASNTPLYQHMEEDMDINCGVVIDGEQNIEELGRYIFEQILEVASGRKTKSELLGVGESEFTPWPIGVFA